MTPVDIITVKQGEGRGHGVPTGRLSSTDAPATNTAQKGVKVDSSHPIFKGKRPANDPPVPPQRQVAKVAVNAPKDVPHAQKIDHPQGASAPGQTTGKQRGDPAQAMAGKRRVGKEHTSNIRPSTTGEHKVGRTRTQRQNAAADLRNALAREEVLNSRVRKLAAKIESTLKNLPEDSGKRRYLSTDGIDPHVRYQSILNDFSAAELEDLEQLRTQLRRELNIRGSELDDYIIDHLDKLGLLPVRPE